MEASMTLRGPMALLGPLIGWRMRVDGHRVLEDLRHSSSVVRRIRERRARDVLRDEHC